MKNYAKEWKETVNFLQISYDDFVTEYPDISAIFMEKVDGMLGVLIYKNGNAFFQTTKGHEITDLPAIDEYINFFKKNNIEEAKIAGELVAQKGKEILPFNRTQSIVKTAYKIPAYKDMVHHYAVDIISLDNKPMAFGQAISYITKKLPHTKHINIPRIKFGKMETFRELYKSIEDVEGFDGVVIRGTRRNIKVKYVNTVDLLIMGAGKEGLPAWEKGQVSYLLTSFIDKNGLYRSSSKIGTGYKTHQRAKFYKFVKENMIYRLNGEYFIKPGLIVEMKFFRYLLTETPTYQFKNGLYTYVGSNKSVTFSHPSFVRIREDKKANKFDVRLEQIPKFIY
jgi:ATP-dependent DNA ligase